MIELNCTDGLAFNLNTNNLLIKISWTTTLIILIFSISIKSVSNFNISKSINFIFIFVLLFALKIFHNLLEKGGFIETFMLIFYIIFDGTNQRYLIKQKCIN